MRHLFNRGNPRFGGGADGFSIIGLLLIFIVVALLFLLLSCATLSKFLQLAQDPFPIKLVFFEEMIPVNIPGHWPKNVLAFPKRESPFFYPIWITVYTDPQTNMTYHFAIHTVKKKVCLLLQYKTYPSIDDRKFYIFIDGLPIMIGIDQVRNLWNRILSEEKSSGMEIYRAYLFYTEANLCLISQKKLAPIQAVQI